MFVQKGKGNLKQRFVNKRKKSQPINMFLNSTSIHLKKAFKSEENISEVQTEMLLIGQKK